jgi:hypothetical protein
MPIVFDEVVAQVGPEPSGGSQPPAEAPATASPIAPLERELRRREQRRARLQAD